MAIPYRLVRWPAALLLLVVVAFVLRSDDLSYAQAGHVSSGRDCRRVVALTFDDGPNPPYTERVLGVLTRNGAPATFFVEGQAAAAHPETVKLLIEAGMAIGSHSYAHSSDLAKMPAADFRLDLTETENVLRGISGQKPQLYRAPFGQTSLTMLKELRENGYTSVGWDIDSTDWRETAPDKISGHVLSEAHPGAIVLLHDGGLSGGNPGRSGTVEALPAIIAGLRESGYDLVTVPEILDPAICNAGLP